jgi:hypothetical protein
VFEGLAAGIYIHSTASGVVEVPLRTLLWLTGAD